MKPLKHEFSTTATAKTVYEALTTPTGIQGWWAKVSTIAEGVGGSNELRFDKDGQIFVMTSRIDALEPGRVVRWTCAENANPAWKGSTLAWTIDNAGELRVVGFVHDGLAASGPPYEMTVEGWRHFNASLESFLNGRGGTPSD